MITKLTKIWGINYKGGREFHNLIVDGNSPAIIKIVLESLPYNSQHSGQVATTHLDMKTYSDPSLSHIYAFTCFAV